MAFSYSTIASLAFPWAHVPVEAYADQALAASDIALPAVRHLPGWALAIDS